jgi:hypothetical protein
MSAISINNDMLGDPLNVQERVITASRTCAAPGLRKDILVQLGVCALVLLAGFYGKVPALGGYAFSLCLGSFLIYRAARKDRFGVLSLFVSAIPLMALLRGTFMPFNMPVATLGAYFLWIAVSPGIIGDFWKRKDVIYLTGAAALYWLISFLLTGDYARNLRSIEWALTIAGIAVLSQRRSYLGTA